jgi:histidinol dehydrogenase
VLASIEEAIDFSNVYAPEHLILGVANAESYVANVKNAGSVFLGYMAAESLGDYASGTNHVLPTGRFVTTTSGVSVDTFVKKITFQSVTTDGIASIGATVVEMARAEGLEAHAHAVVVRQGGAR